MSRSEVNVPMFDYRQGHAAIRDDVAAAVQEVLDSGQLILGPKVRAFEDNFVEFLGIPGYAAGVGNGTDAIAIALRALGIGPGDEVITVPNTAIPTVSAIRMTGAMPVFVDVDDATCLMDAASIEARITSRTRAIIPVHLFGSAVPMEPILAIAAAHSLKIVEDCAQSTGTTYKDRATGTFGDVGCFSFYPTKNLGAYGDGGLCYTRDSAVADSIRQIRMYGCGKTYYAEREGINSRLDEIHAAILDVKLRHLPAYLHARRRIAACYRANLRPIVCPPAVPEGVDHSYHLFVVKANERARIIAALKADGIGFGIHYGTPIHLMEAYRFLGHKPGDFPVCERLANQVLSLPCFPELTESAVERVWQAVNRSDEIVSRAS